MRINAVAVLFIRIIGAGLGFIITSKITKSFSQNDVGIYFYILSVLGVVTAFASVGLNNVVLRKVASKIKTANEILNTASLIVITASLIIIPVTIIYLYFQGLEEYAAAVTAILLMAVVNLFSHGLQGLGKTKQAIFLGSVFYQVVFLFLIQWNKVNDLTNLFESYVISYFVTMVSIILLWVKNTQHNIIFDRDLKSYLKPAIPLIVFQIFQEFNVAIGQLSLGLKNYHAEVAIYAVCFKISTLIGFVGFAINRVFSPEYARAYSEYNKEKLQSLLCQTRNLSIIFITPLIIGALVFASEILTLFGQQYISYAWFLRLTLISQVLSLINGSLAYFMIMCGHEKNYTKQVISATLIAFSLVYFLIDLAPLEVALSGFVLIQVLIFFSTTYYMKSKLDMKYWKFS